jgi:hypothetical protein
LLLRPTVIVLEDVHWLDEGFGGAAEPPFGHARGAGRGWWCDPTRTGRRLFFVPEDAKPVQIWLEALTADASAETDRANAGELPITAHQAEELANPCRRQPVVPLPKLLAAALSGPTASRRLPDSVEALMIREIDRLSPPARRMLRSAAASSGRRSNLDLLRTCLGEPWDNETWASLEPFVVAQEGAAYRFRHMLARDAAYEGLPYRRRRELHALVGDELKARAGAATDDEAGPPVAPLLPRAPLRRGLGVLADGGCACAEASGRMSTAAALYERALAAGRHLAVTQRRPRLRGRGAWRPCGTGPVITALAEGRLPPGAKDARGRSGRRGPVVAEAGVDTATARSLFSQALRWIGRAQRLLEGLPGGAGRPAARRAPCLACRDQHQPGTIRRSDRLV